MLPGVQLGEFLIMDFAGFSHEVSIIALGFYLNIIKMEKEGEYEEKEVFNNGDESEDEEDESDSNDIFEDLLLLPVMEFKVVSFEDLKLQSGSLDENQIGLVLKSRSKTMVITSPK